MSPDELEATRCPICHIRLGHDVHCPDYPYSTRVKKWQAPFPGVSTGNTGDIAAIGSATADDSTEDSPDVA